mmetsp:Transcript_20741/g.84300  ORF Transcript_20741/g.84300 Transcript_20741/m.84300 type:complete len:974 (+) Transcript_20741:908-3829(+)
MQRKLKSLYKRDLEDLVTRCGAPAWKRTKDDLARMYILQIFCLTSVESTTRKTVTDQTLFAAPLLALRIVDFLLSFNGGGGYYPTMLNRQDQGPLFINSNWDAEAASQHLTLHVNPSEGQRRMNFRLSHVIGVDEVDRLLPELEPLKSLDPRFQAFDAPLGKPRFLCQTFTEWREGALRIHFVTPEALQFRRPKNLRVHLRFLRVENYRGGTRTTSFCPKNWSFDVNSLTVFLPKDQLDVDRSLSLQAEYFLDLTPFLKKKRGGSDAMNTVEIKGIDYSRLRQNALHCVLAQTVTVKDREALVRMVRASTVEYFDAYKPPDEKGVVRLDEVLEEGGHNRTNAASPHPTRTSPLEKARQKELTKFSAGPDDIKVDSISFSMKCPLSQSRIDIPVKGRKCNHVQCFNLESYLTMETTRKSDECPVCNQKTASIQQLYICPLNEEALQVFPHADEVELHPDGRLSLPTPQTSLEEGQVAEQIDLESDQPLSSLGARSFTTPPYTPRPAKRRKSVITIDLTDEGDDEVPVTPRISPQLSATFNRLNRDRMRLQLLQSMDRHVRVETATVPLNSGEERSQSRAGNFGTSEIAATVNTPAARRVLPSSVTGGSQPRNRTGTLERTSAPVDIEPPNVFMEIDPADLSFGIDSADRPTENSAQRAPEPPGSDPTESDFEKAIAEVFGNLKEPEEIIRDREHEKSVSKTPAASLPVNEEVGESVEKPTAEPSEAGEPEPLPVGEAGESSIAIERGTSGPENETEEPSLEKGPGLSNEETASRSVENETEEPSLEKELQMSKKTNTGGRSVDGETGEESLEGEPETSNEKDMGGKFGDNKTEEPSLEGEPEISEEKGAGGSSIQKGADTSSLPDEVRAEISQHESVVSPDELVREDILVGMQVNEKSICEAVAETVVGRQPPTPVFHDEAETLIPGTVPINSARDFVQEMVKQGPSEVSAEVSIDREADRTCSQVTPTNNSAS